MNSFRSMRAISCVSALLLSCLLSLAGCARDCTPQIRDGWVRMPPPGMPGGGMAMLAGFGRIENRCASPVTVIGAHSVAFAGVSLHEARIVGGISQMRAVPELRIGADDAAVLKPGGLHLMLMRPTTRLKAGSRVAIEFQLQDGRKLLGEFELRKP